jgi:transcriptional regulator GlxA family with amidase domain
MANTAADVTGALATMLGALIEMAASDAYYQELLRTMQAEGRQSLTDEEKVAIRSRLDVSAQAAQDAIDGMA